MTEGERDMLLSDAGERRREEMLGELLAQMNRVRRRRLATRAGMFAAVLLAAGIGIATIAQRPALHRSGTIAAANENRAVENGSGSRPLIIQVATDPAVFDRYCVRREPSRIERISDDELLETLAAMDRPSGLIRTASSTRLTADVTGAVVMPLRDDTRAPSPESAPLEELFALAGL